MTDEPTTSEVWRAFQDFRAEARGALDGLRREQAGYVRTDTFEEVRRATGERVGAVEKDLAVMGDRYSKLGYFILGSALLPLLFFLANYLLTH